MLRSVLRRTNRLQLRNITSTSTCTFPITSHSLPCRNMSGLPPKPQTTTIVNPWANVQVRERPVQTGPGVAHDMTGHILSVFETAKKSKRTVFVGYVTAGYPSVDESIDILLTMQNNGVDIIEVGVPFSDPLAEGPTIQRSNQRALENGVDSVDACLALVKRAREAGVTVPILFMGYYNPFRLYNTRGNLMRDAHAAGVSGFIIVDLPPEESDSFRQSCREEHLSFVPLITPTTTEERISHLVSCADSFIYAVSLLGTTGARATISDELPGLIKKIKSRTSLPIAVGFGIGDAASYARVAAMSDGVVIGSAIINTLDKSPRETRMSDLAKWIRSVHQREDKDVILHVQPPLAKDAVKQEKVKATIQDSAYRFGDFGGRYVPETLVAALDELEVQYNRAKSDPTFFEEVRSYWDYIGRPSRLHEAQRLTQYAGGAKIYLKREDLNHTGAHKINNAVAQAILSKRLGKKRLIAETGAGQHGVATATICAKMGIPLTVYMGSEDVARQQLNVFRMKVMGATVVPVDSGSRTLKDAINEAMRDWVTNIRDTHYLIGSAIGPHPFPTIVRDFQSVIGSESREQILKLTGKLPDAVVACVGGGSNAIGMFYPFKDDKSVRLIGVEAGGEGLDTVNHSATLSAGTPGVLHGTRTYLLQDRQTGQISGTHSISAGLDYPGVGPEHAHLKDTQRAEYVVATDKQCLEGFSLLCRLEGIIPALESSHAIYAGIQLAKTMKSDQSIIICLSGRGDKDLDTVMRELPKHGF